jgi:hypothetical protein
MGNFARVMLEDVRAWAQNGRSADLRGMIDMECPLSLHRLSLLIAQEDSDAKDSTVGMKFDRTGRPCLLRCWGDQPRTVAI